MGQNRAEAVEETVSRPDGVPRVWLSTKAPFRDQQGTVVGLVGGIRRHHPAQAGRAAPARERGTIAGAHRQPARRHGLPALDRPGRLRAALHLRVLRVPYVSYVFQSHERLTGAPAEAVLADASVAY